MKLQNAYIAETGDQLGNWFLIGYKGPGDVTTAGSKTTAEVSASTNFVYTGEFAGSVALSTGGVGWKAANKAKLNDCAGNGSTYNWTIRLPLVLPLVKLHIRLASQAPTAKTLLLALPLSSKKIKSAKKSFP